MKFKINKSKVVIVPSTNPNFRILINEVSSFKWNLALSRWYKKFQEVYTSKGYELKQLDVNDSLLQAEDNEPPKNKLMAIKKDCKEEKYYLFLYINNTVTADYQRYKNICKHLLEINENYHLNINLLLIYSTKKALNTDVIEEVVFDDLHVLATSLEGLQLNSKSLSLYKYNYKLLCFNLLSEDNLFNCK